MAKTVRRANPSYMRQPPVLEEKSLALSNFTGGLDLYRDGGQLSPEYTVDLLNIDLQAGGGFARRKAIRAWSTGTDASGPIRSVSRLEKEDGTTWMAVTVGDGVYKMNPASPNFSTTVITPTVYTATGATWRLTQANYKGYFQNGTSAPRKWDGSTVTTLAQVFNSSSPKYGTYSQGGMPIAESMAVWHGRMWAANTTESSVARKSRLRWSFPMVNGIGETDWHPDDYVEVDPGVDGDKITALIPAGDRLYIFKAHSIHQIQGWDESNFEVFPLTRGMGCERPEAAVQFGDSVYFWDDAFGVVKINAEGVQNVFRPLEKLLPRKSAQSDPNAAMGVSERRIWVTFTDNTGERATYVFDPGMVDQQSGFGGWTKFDLRFSCFYAMHSPSEYRMIYLGANDDPTAPYHLCELEVDADYDFTGSGNRSIRSWFRTAWLSDGTPYDEKRVWCIEMVVDAGQAQSFSVSFYGDWDEATRIEDLSFTEQDTTIDNPFILNKSLVAPTVYELKRPLGYAAPGAYLGYEPGPPQYPGSGTTPGYDTIPYDTDNIYDNPSLSYGGGAVGSGSAPSTAVDTTYTDPYVPLSYTPEPCLDAAVGFDRVAPVRDSTLLLKGRVTMPAVRSVQLLFQGALPSKPWAVRAIMLKYRLIK